MIQDSVTEPSAPPPSLGRRLVFGANPRRTLVRAVAIIIGSFILFGFVLRPIRIQGDSMYPAYKDKSINFVNRLAYLWRKPQRGDVVAVKTTGLHILYLKRVVGLPGETIAIAQGKVLIDGEPLDEPYVANRKAWDVEPLKLAPDQYYFIGDNRGMDQDLHEFGPAKAAKIAGKVLW
jgi:signal peptidase I